MTDFPRIYTLSENEEIGSERQLRNLCVKGFYKTYQMEYTILFIK